MAAPYVPYDGPIVTRSAAKAADDVFYFTGRPCSRGHLALRYASSCECRACHAVNNSAWVSSHREVRRADDRKRYASNPEKYRAKSKTPRAKAYGARWYREHRDRVLEQTSARVAANPELKRAQRQRYYLAHPERFKENSRNNYARRKGAAGYHSQEQIRELIKKQRYRCANAVCRKNILDSYHEDHIVPLVLGGTNFISNIQLLCPACNLSKGRKDPIEWARRQGLLV